MKIITRIFTLLLLWPQILLAGHLEYNLLDAVGRGDLDHMRELISQGADVNQKQPPFGQAPIIVAPLQGIKVVKLLLDSGADINAEDEVRNTALINAALYGNLEVVKFLLENGADISVINNDGIDAIEAARLSGNQSVLKLLQSRSK